MRWSRPYTAATTRCTTPAETISAATPQGKEAFKNVRIPHRNRPSGRPRLPRRGAYAAVPRAQAKAPELRVPAVRGVPRLVLRVRSALVLRAGLHGAEGLGPGHTGAASRPRSVRHDVRDHDVVRLVREPPSRPALSADPR